MRGDLAELPRALGGTAGSSAAVIRANVKYEDEGHGSSEVLHCTNVIHFFFPEGIYYKLPDAALEATDLTRFQIEQEAYGERGGEKQYIMENNC